MKQFIALFKLNFRYYTLPDLSDKKSRNKYIALIAVMALCFILPIAGLFMTLYTTATLAFLQGGTVEMLSGVFSVSQITVLFLSAFPYISSMFFAKDNEIMLNFPVPQITVFSAKLLVTYVNELLISTIVVLPASVITAIAAAQAGVVLGAQFYVLIPVAVLLLPLLPMLLLSIISFPIALVIQKLSKRPVLGAIVQAVFLIAFIVGVYYLSYSTSYSVGNEDGQALDIEKIFAPMAKVNVFTTMLAKAMFGVNAVGNFFAFLGSTAGFALVSGGLSVLFYKRALQSSAEGEGGVRKKAAKEVKESGVKSPTKAFILSDVKYLLRESYVTVNTILSLIMPALFVFLCTYLTTSSMQASMQAASEAGEGADAGGFVSTPYLSLALSVMMAGWFCSGTNLFSTVGFSLERENFAVIKTLPVAFDKIYYSKLIAATVVTVISTVIASVVTVVISKLTVWDFILMTVLLSVYGTAVNAFALLRDLKAPRFNWITVKELTKNNFHTLVPMLVSMAGMLPVIIVAFVGAFVESFSDLARSAMVWGVFAAVDVVFALLFVYRAGDKALKYFEECEC